MASSITCDISEFIAVAGLGVASLLRMEGVGFQVPADPLGSNTGVRAEILPSTYLHLAALLESKLSKEQHKRRRVYTSSGHHCGVIPYSSVWCGGLPLGLNMNNTRKNNLARVCSWLARQTARGSSVAPFYWFQDLDPRVSTLWVDSPIYSQRHWASSQILSGKGANNWPF